MPVSLIVTIVVGVLVMIVWFFAVISRKTYENVKRIADRLHLELEVTKPVMGFYRTPEATGMIRGKRVRVYQFSEGSGKSSKTWSAVSVIPGRSSTLTFCLIRQGFLTKMLGVFGHREIEVGDEKFDKHWFIQTNAPEFLAAGLLPEMQRKIDEFEGKWELKDNVVLYQERGTFNSDERCARWLTAVDVACDLADAAEVYAQRKA